MYVVELCIQKSKPQIQLSVTQIRVFGRNTRISFKLN